MTQDQAPAEGFQDLTVWTFGERLMGTLMAAAALVLLVAGAIGGWPV